MAGMVIMGTRVAESAPEMLQPYNLAVSIVGENMKVGKAGLLQLRNQQSEFLFCIPVNIVTTVTGIVAY